jgi:hypothetical protein
VQSGRRLFSDPALAVGFALAYSPDGRTLAVAALAGIDLFLLRSGDGSVQRRFFPFDYARSVAFSPDGKVLAAGRL